MIRNLRLFYNFNLTNNQYFNTPNIITQNNFSPQFVLHPIYYTDDEKNYQMNIKLLESLIKYYKNKCEMYEKIIGSKLLDNKIVDNFNFIDENK